MLQNDLHISIFLLVCKLPPLPEKESPITLRAAKLDSQLPTATATVHLASNWNGSTFEFELELLSESEFELEFKVKTKSHIQICFRWYCYG